MIEKYCMAFTREEWIQLAEDCKKPHIRFHILYGLGMTRCPHCDEMFYSSTNFCSNCGLNIREYIANSGLKEVLTNE